MTLEIIDYLFLEPNWATPVLYKRKWDTRFQVSIKGSETRSSIVSWPRISLIYTLTLTSAIQSNYIKRKLYKNLHNVWGIPYWTERTYLSSQANSGQPIINVNEAQYRSFEVGSPLVILKNVAEYEVKVIDSVNVNEITFTENLVATWDENTDVYPLLKVRLNPTQQMGMFTSNTGFIEIEAEEAIDVDITHESISISGFDTYRGKYIFDITPNWVQNFSMSIDHPYQLLRYYGVGYSRSETTESIIKSQALFLGVDNETLNKFLGFFDEHKGRLSNFWFPSNQRDIEITVAFSAAETSFSINDIEWLDYWKNNALMGHFVQFTFPDGIKKYREILSASSTELIIDNAIGKEITTVELPNLQVSFLWMVRFDSDEIEIKKHNANTGEIDLRFSSIFDTDDVSVSTTTTTSTTSSTSTSSSTTSSTTSTTVLVGSTTTSSTTSTTNTLSTTTSSTVTESTTTSSTSTTVTVLPDNIWEDTTDDIWEDTTDDIWEDI